ncbi:MAG: glutaminase domain-containing protein [Fimbriimonadaceae bacterium]
MLTLASALAMGAVAMPNFRPPTVPLVTHDPYFSVWSFTDRLNQDWPRHWTGKPFGMAGLVRVGDLVLRWCGPDILGVPAIEQTDVRVEATTTTYRFRAEGITLSVEFCSPLLLSDLDLVSRPVTYVTFTAEASQPVSVYVDQSAEWCLDQPGQSVTWSRAQLAPLTVLRMGSKEQAVLNRAGDDLRIDWGWNVLAAELGARDGAVIASHHAARQAFVRDGKLPSSDEWRMPRPGNDQWPVQAMALDLSHGPRTVMMAYDDVESVEYFRRPLKGYWTRNGTNFAEMLLGAYADRAATRAAATAYDADFRSRAQRQGGDRYADIAALAYRQSIAAHKLVADLDGRPLMFSKENFSNGCIGTVDVTYPGAPLYLMENPVLLWAQIEPVMEYAQMPRWKFPFAPHDLGTYPKANGQVYGGGERTEEDQMPVEECGNMLILVAAALRSGIPADQAMKYAEVLRQWADYLVQYGLDPEHQLCTDDFAGHMARNANLSVKAIMGIAAYSRMATAFGKTEDETKYASIARDYAAKWVEMARTGDHTVLAFGNPGTWSQKYNMVWDTLLGFGLFPAELKQQEIRYYLTKQNVYGLPLDNRATYTKLDWILWTATMTNSTSDFDLLVDPVWKFLNESPSRVPMTDWYDTVSGQMVGFRARSVVGGVMMPMLAAKWRATGSPPGERR